MMPNTSDDGESLKMLGFSRTKCLSAIRLLVGGLHHRYDHRAA